MVSAPEHPFSDQSVEHARLSFEREKWRDEFTLRQREIEIKRLEQGRARWSNPLVIAVFAAAVAAVGNAAVAWLTAHEQRRADTTRAEQTLAANEIKAEADRILESIRTNNDPDKAATNLRFLVESGLISNEKTKGTLKAYLDNRNKGEGPALPAAATVVEPRLRSLTSGMLCSFVSVPKDRRRELKSSLEAILREQYNPTDLKIHENYDGRDSLLLIWDDGSIQVQYNLEQIILALPYFTYLGRTAGPEDKVIERIKRVADKADCRINRI